MGYASGPPRQENMDNLMVITIVADFRCCQGCRNGLRSRLQKEEGVRKVELDATNALITVLAECWLETDPILKIVRKFKRTSRLVEVYVPPPVARSTSCGWQDAEAVAGGDIKPLTPKNEMSANQERVGALSKKGRGEEDIVNPGVPPKPISPVHPIAPLLPTQSSLLEKGQTLVREQIYPEEDGVKIRTRVTTTQDGNSCIVYEEIQFHIDKLKQETISVVP